MNTLQKTNPITTCYVYLLVEMFFHMDEFFYNSCGMLIWVRIIPVKADQNFTGIIRTYIIIDTVKEKKRKSIYSDLIGYAEPGV